MSALSGLSTLKSILKISGFFLCSLKQMNSNLSIAHAWPAAELLPYWQNFLQWDGPAQAISVFIKPYMN